FEAIKQTVDGNVRAKGWLIFATHDVCDQPTRFGCSPSLFEEVVRYSINSGATVLPVSRALNLINAGTDLRQSGLRRHGSNGDRNTERFHHLAMEFLTGSSRYLPKEFTVFHGKPLSKKP